MHRDVVEGELLVTHRFRDGLMRLAGESDAPIDSGLSPRSNWFSKFLRHFRQSAATRIPEVRVPSGAYLILRDIPGALQQRYGLQSREGATFEAGDETWESSVLRFSNGVEIPLEGLREGQLIEVLSLAGAYAYLFENDLVGPGQMRSWAVRNATR